jgi:hypothetical protein
MKNRLLFIFWVILIIISIGGLGTIIYMPYWVITGKSSYQLFEDLTEPLCPNID